MADEAQPICLNCVSKEIAADVLMEFSEGYPDVRMSYDEWMSLGLIIEDQIKAHLNPSDDEEGDPHGLTVQ